MDNLYYKWLYDIVCANRYENISYNNLLSFLFKREFIYSLEMDENRYIDGISMRDRYEATLGNEYSNMSGPCSVLEMLVALAVRIEEMVNDPKFGDRTSQWFWMMITNLGIADMIDERFDEDRANRIISRFLNRRYTRDGKGNIFYIPDSEEDLREVEIWYQLCWYLNTIFV